MSNASGQLVTVFGGSGFVGRHVVRALARRGYRIRVAVRRPDLAYFLQPLGGVGQIHAVQANLRHAQSVEHAMAGSHAVINLVGILSETGKQRFSKIQAEGAAVVARAARDLGIEHRITRRIGVGLQISLARLQLSGTEKPAKREHAGDHLARVVADDETGGGGGELFRCPRE